MKKVLSIILFGGKGTRLYPLTRERSKPAVPFGGKYRLVDIPISNCLNSGINQICILAQFNSASLYKHISGTYNFDAFGSRFVEVLTPQQTLENSGWYNGTADAVRKCFSHLQALSPAQYLILCGDQIYQMDFSALVREHRASGAEITVAVTPVSAERAFEHAFIQTDGTGRITKLVERSAPAADLTDMKIPRALREEFGPESGKKPYLASIGIYLFDAEVLAKVLDNSMVDFGMEVLPSCLERVKVRAYLFSGFWEEIGTIKTFYETSISFAAGTSSFNPYCESHPIYTRMQSLPPSKLDSCTVKHSLTAEGCIISRAVVRNSIIGARTVVREGAVLDGVICMGADVYETDADREANRERHEPDLGIGMGSAISRTIIDENVKIGSDCRIGVDDIPRKDCDNELYSVRDGIIVIPANTVIPAGSVL